MFILFECSLNSFYLLFKVNRKKENEQVSTNRLTDGFCRPATKKVIGVLRENVPDQAEFGRRKSKFDVLFMPSVVDVIDGKPVERFRKYEDNKITINFNKEEHVSNPLELVDTLIHELVHALCACPPNVKQLVLS